VSGTDSYWSAVAPDPVRILGLELQPFSAGHILLLHRTGNVFALGGEVSEEHLAAAVFICAHNFRDGLAALNDEKTPKFMAKWRKKIGAVDVPAATQLFQDYIKAGSDFPLQYSAKPQRGGNSVSITNLPTVHIVRCQLKHYYHTPEAEFWDMPWGLAQWDYFTIPVMEGQGDLVETTALDNAQAVAEQLFRLYNPRLFPRTTETASNG
jgi:hypothetical protein